ncbi:hypothetical protein J1N35_005537 [Gossypium stocksii]|uniref:Uncharacterized protein n=1 Tax=Gossypium stocksii TaxID=47602 RepID=A0A9D3WEQ2_9ROSI|nr:hypothetical protein J1N35_005537 [Gossypium stocksii]
MSSLKYRYLASDDPAKYEIFNVRGLVVIEAMAQMHNATGSPIIELYVEFVSVDEGGRRSTMFPLMLEQNKKLKVQPHYCAVGL